MMAQRWLEKDLDRERRSGEGSVKDGIMEREKEGSVIYNAII